MSKFQIKQLEKTHSVICLYRRRLNTMNSKPIVTITKNANPNHPNTIAELPTPLLTLPLPKSCAMELAATLAVCCHRTDTRMKTDATKIRARATCETGREGIGFTSASSSPVSSTCQPGKDRRSTKQKKARTRATILIYINGQPHSENKQTAVMGGKRT